MPIHDADKLTHDLASAIRNFSVVEQLLRDQTQSILASDLLRASIEQLESIKRDFENRDDNTSPNQKE